MYTKQTHSLSYEGNARVTTPQQIERDSLHYVLDIRMGDNVRDFKVRKKINVYTETER